MVDILESYLGAFHILRAKFTTCLSLLSDPARSRERSADILADQIRQPDLLSDVDQVDVDVIALARDHNLAEYDAEF